MTRKIKKKIKILVEGPTEENYFDSFNKEPNLEFSIKPVNMAGGGYSNFLKILKKEDALGFLAVFIFIDLDKSNSEKKELDILIQYCNSRNKSSDIPYFLIGTNKDFEFFSCTHCINYKNQDTSSYITNTFKYKSVAEFKADTKIFQFLNNKKNRSYKNAINKLKKIGSYFSHRYEIEKKGIDITIKLKGELLLDDTKLVCQHSNIYEFFEIMIE